MKPTLFLLAAGMGSRYGGLKQLDGLGPNGETIMDYSIYDAIRAGFGKLVFVIRKDFEQDFRDKILSKYESHWTTCPKDSPARQNVQNRGARTMPS